MFGGKKNADKDKKKSNMAKKQQREDDAEGSDEDDQQESGSSMGAGSSLGSNGETIDAETADAMRGLNVDTQGELPVRTGHKVYLHHVDNGLDSESIDELNKERSWRDCVFPHHAGKPLDDLEYFTSGEFDSVILDNGEEKVDMIVTPGAPYEDLHHYESPCPEGVHIPTGVVHEMSLFFALENSHARPSEMRCKRIRASQIHDAYPRMMHWLNRPGMRNSHHIIPHEITLVSESSTICVPMDKILKTSNISSREDDIDHIEWFSAAGVDHSGRVVSPIWPNSSFGNGAAAKVVFSPTDELLSSADFSRWIHIDDASAAKSFLALEYGPKLFRMPIPDANAQHFAGFATWFLITYFKWISLLTNRAMKVSGSDPLLEHTNKLVFDTRTKSRYIMFNREIVTSIYRDMRNKYDKRQILMCLDELNLELSPLDGNESAADRQFEEIKKQYNKECAMMPIQSYHCELKIKFEIPTAINSLIADGGKPV